MRKMRSLLSTRALALLAAPLAFACKSEAPRGLPECPPLTVLDAEGRCATTCERAEQCLRSEACVEGVCTAVSYDVPTVLLLEAWPQVVEVGGEASVRYLVQGADRVELLRREAGVPEQSITTDTEQPEGGREIVGRIVRPTTIRLEAWRGERMDFEEVTIGVRGVVGDVNIVDFSVDRPQVRPGDEVTLSWTVENADIVRITKDDAPLLETREAEGLKLDTVEADAIYVLTAEGERGFPQTAQVSVTVRDAPPPSVIVHGVGIIPDSREIGPGDNAVLWWGTEGASSLVVGRAGSQGAVYGTTNPALVNEGLWLLSPPPGEHTYVVRAQSEQGSAMGSDTLRVRARPPVPELRDVVASPEVMPPDSEGVGVTVSWEVTPPNAQVVVTDPDGGSTAYAGSGQHQTMVRGGQTAFFSVRAVVNDGGMDEVTVPVFAQVNEEEVNDTRGAADEIDFVARSGVSGRVGTNLDIDWYRLDVGQDDGTLVARFHGTMCPPGFQLQLYEEGSASPLVSNQAGGNGLCPTIERVGVGVGRYYLRVSQAVGSGMAGVAYSLSSWVRAPTCGNGRREVGEQCDDGNRAFGDACSPMCTIAPTHALRIERRDEPESPWPSEVEPLAFNGYRQNVSELDEGIGVVDLPFDFPWFGRTFRGVAVFTNGFLSFLPTNEDGFDLEDFVGPAAPNAIIAPFAANLVVGGNVYAWSDFDPDDGAKRLVVQYDDLVHADEPTAVFTAQVQLYEDGRAAVLYEALPVDKPFFGFVEGPDGVVIQPLPGCDDGGCDPSQLLGRRFVIRNAVATAPGGN